MKLNRTMSAGLGVVLILVAQMAYGLTAEQARNVRAGDLLDEQYWRAKFDAMMLDDAVKTRQPDGAIAGKLEGYQRLLDELAVKYPLHRDIKQWKDREEQVRVGLSPFADRQAAFSNNFLWSDKNYAEAWINLNRGALAENRKDFPTALACYNLAAQRLDYLVENPETMKDYSENARSWVKQQLSLAERKRDEAGDRVREARE